MSIYADKIVLCDAAAEIDKLRLLLVRWWATLDQSEDCDLVQDTVSALKDYKPIGSAS